jgi:hypothetical protein
VALSGFKSGEAAAAGVNDANDLALGLKVNVGLVTDSTELGAADVWDSDILVSVS